MVEASPSVATRRLTFSEAKALPRTCPEVPRYAPNQRDTYKVFVDRVAPKADKVSETYALLDSGSTHSFIADDIAAGYPQQLGTLPTFTTLGSGVTPTKTALVPIVTADCIVTVSCGVLPAGKLPAHTQMVLGRYDYEEVLRVDSERVRQLYKEGKRLFRAPYRPLWEVTDGGTILSICLPRRSPLAELHANWLQ